MSQDKPAAKKIGSGHAAAMARLGIKELRAAAYPEISNIAQPSEPGLYGHSTQGEVAESRRSDEHDDEREIDHE